MVNGAYSHMDELIYLSPLQWRHYEHDGVSNQPHHCLLNHLFRRRSKQASKLRVTGLWPGNSGNSPVNSMHKWPVTRKMFLFDDVIMTHFRLGTADKAASAKLNNLIFLLKNCDRQQLTINYTIWIQLTHFSSKRYGPNEYGTTHSSIKHVSDFAFTKDIRYQRPIVRDVKKINGVIERLDNITVKIFLYDDMCLD